MITGKTASEIVHYHYIIEKARACLNDIDGYAASLRVEGNGKSEVCAFSFALGQETLETLLCEIIEDSNAKLRELNLLAIREAHVGQDDE